MSETRKIELQGNQFNLTPKEELAVIVQRLKGHIEDCEDLRAKTLLEVATDCVRNAIHKR